MRGNITFLVLWCYWHWHQMVPMAHDTDANIATITDTKCHKIPLNNLITMTNSMGSLMALSVLCDRKHVFTMYVPKNNIPLKCLI